MFPILSSKENIALILSALSFSFASEDAGTRELSPTQLKEDITVLRKALEKYHPGLYWYTSKNEFALIWDSLNAKIKEPMTEEDFF